LDLNTENVSTGGLLSLSMEKTAARPNSIQGYFLTVQEFRRWVNCDKSQHKNQYDDKYVSWWNHGFVATAPMHHTDMALNEKYIPKNCNENIVFTEMQICMYAVFEELLKTSIAKLLMS
jgi:hypothetical protein